MHNSVKDIRALFKAKHINDVYVTDKTGVKTIEIVNANFIADEPTIFGKLNQHYIKRELDWYLSESLNVNDIEGDVPKIWQMISDKGGKINSNYGLLTMSEQYHNQQFGTNTMKTACLTLFAPMQFNT